MAEELKTGTILQNRYEVKGTIDSGGMSTIYEVEDRRLSTRCALKQMQDVSPDPQEQAALAAQFKKEAEFLAQLTHPNLPKVIDCFVEDGSDYLVEEYVGGETLAQMVEAGKEFSEDDARAIASQILDVLDYIHRQNIVYRDLKPGNVKMSPEGHVKLLDFGIARLHQIGKAQDTIILGTPGFSPPEQYGTGQTDARSDLYSLAAMLYFLLTGRDNSRTPFVYPPLRTLRPDVSRSFEESLARALQLSPEARFSNAKAFRDALERREFVLIQERVFSYGIPPPRLNDYISGAAILLALPVGLLFLVPDAVTLPLAALGLLLSSIPVRLYLTCRRKSATRLRVSESGIEYTDDSRTITCSWDEVEELIFQHSADATVEAGEVRVMTAKGTFSFDTAPYGHPPASTPGGLKPRRSPTLVLLEKGPELTEIIINRGGLLPRFAGSNSFVRKKE